MKHTLIALSMIFLAAAFAQTPAQPLKFDAASIKENHSSRNGYDSQTTPGALTMRNYTLRMLIAEANDLKTPQVVGGPKWADADRYDIAAKAAGPADDEELYRMLQTLMAERFHLVSHRESRPLPGYALVADKRVFKLTPAEDTGKGSSSSHGGPTTFKQISMANLANWVARRLNVPVVDATGIPGVFDFTLDWIPENRRPAAAQEPGLASDPFPTLLTALKDQLGIRGESRKVPTDVIVIDSAEKASEN